MRYVVSLGIALCLAAPLYAQAPKVEQPANTWVLRSPLKEAPIAPNLGYEGALGYDPKAKVVIRWAGHNQSGGGEQNSETWTIDPVTFKWTLKEANTSPPGACCCAQNLFDPVGGRYVRFPAFSGSHGWHWFRENYLSNSSLWTYDLPTNTWRDMRPLPTTRPSPYRAASWDSDYQVAVVFGGQGNKEGTTVYDPYDNSWTRLKMSLQPKPGKNGGGNLAYDKHQKRHVKFGTQVDDDQHTWILDLAKGEWTDVKTNTLPPTDQNDAVLAYDENNKLVVCVVCAKGEPDNNSNKEGWHYQTWGYDVAGSTWRKLNPPAEPSFPAEGMHRRRIMVAVPDQNMIFMENYYTPSRKRGEAGGHIQQFWTYRYDMPKTAPTLQAPTVTVETTQSGAVLRWQGSTPAEWVVTRADGPNAWTLGNRKTVSLKGDQREYKDESLQNGKTYYYTVAARGGKDTGLASITVRTQPRLVEDVVASVQSPKKVSLTWPAAKESDVVGYIVERAPVEVYTEDQIKRLRTDTAPLDQPSVGMVNTVGKFVTLTKEPIKANTFVDNSIDLSKPAPVSDPIYTAQAGQLHEGGKGYRFGVYAYRVRAVNRLGVQSGASPYVLTIPSSPKWVFSKEEGAKCHLKWAKNPEESIAGYRVYRMESPRINGAGQKVTRVTQDPVAGTTYFDEKAGKDTARYWIVAVDALSQEGIPSAPTWHQRQYKRAYVPFTGEWHQ